MSTGWRRLRLLLFVNIAETEFQFIFTDTKINFRNYLSHKAIATQQHCYSSGQED